MFWWIVFAVGLLVAAVWFFIGDALGEGLRKWKAKRAAAAVVTPGKDEKKPTPWGVWLIKKGFWYAALLTFLYLYYVAPDLVRFLAGIEAGRQVLQEGRAAVYKSRHDDSNPSPVTYSDGAKVTAAQPVVANVTLPASTTPTWRFAGILPPGNYEVSAHLDYSADADFFLVAGGPSGQPKTVEELTKEAADFQQRYDNNPHALTWVLPLPKVSFDDTFRRQDKVEVGSITAWYIQTNNAAKSHSFSSHFKYDSTIGLEDVEVGRKGVTLTLKQTGWDYVVVVPLHEPTFQSSLYGNPVPATGLTPEQLFQAFKAWSLAQGADLNAAERHAKTVVDTYWSAPGYQALLYEGKPFITAKVFEPSEAGTTAHLKLNADPKDSLADDATPFKVRVMWRKSAY